MAEQKSKHNRWKLFGFTLVGAACGYVALTVFANLEDWQFYSIRSFVTGKESMSEIVQHPLDQWVMPFLLIAFVIAGALLGYSFGRRSMKS